MPITVGAAVYFAAARLFGVDEARTLRAASAAEQSERRERVQAPKGAASPRRVAMRGGPAGGAPPPGAQRSCGMRSRGPRKYCIGE